MNHSLNHRLQQLSQRVEALGSSCQPGRPIVRVATGWPMVDAVLGGGLMTGAVHEWLTVSRGEPGSDAVMPLAVWIHLVRQALGNRLGDSGVNDRESDAARGRGRGSSGGLSGGASEKASEGGSGASGGSGGGWSVWVGRRCFAYPHGLMGGDDRLLARSLWVDPPDVAGRLWAIDLAARSPAVAVVVADGQGLDMAATRRLQLAAQAGGSLILLGRLPGEQKQLSAAATRWRVRPMIVGPGSTSRDRAGGISGGTSGGISGGGGVRWVLELLRCKGLQRGSGRTGWLLDDKAGSGLGEWVVEGKFEHGQGLVLVPAEPGTRSAQASASLPTVRKRA